MTAQQVATALLGALNDALPESVRAYELDEVPSPRPNQYVDIGLTRRFGGALKMSGSIGTVGYRVTVQAVARTSIANVRMALELCRAALEFQRLTVDDSSTTPLLFETEETYDLGDGWFSGVQAFTFSL